jgi:hypothetical protein
MIKIIRVLIVLPLLFLGCNGGQKSRDQIDDKGIQSMSHYIPGFGEFMTYIQIHHAKLWFAGKNENWKLAEFEVNEIKETLAAIQKYEKERIESQALPIIYPALDSINTAIQVQEQKLFVHSYTILTNTCNTCHRAVKFEFNIVKIPDSPPFSNQDFSVTR